MADSGASRNGFRTFLILWITQSISIFGTTLSYFAMSIWLMDVHYPAPSQKGALALALALVSLALAVPNLIVAPFAGVWADRYDRRRLMLWMEVLNCGVSLSLLALILTNQLRLWSLLIIAVALAVFSFIHKTAFDASYIMMMSREQLNRANGLMQATEALSMVLAPSIGATMIALPHLAPGLFGSFSASINLGTALVISFDALSYVIAGVTLLFLVIPAPPSSSLSKGGKGIWAETMEGIAYVRRHSGLLWLLVIGASVNLLYAPIQVLRPMLIKYNFAADWMARGYNLEAALALFTTIAGIGSLIGAVVVSVTGGRKHRKFLGILVPVMIVGAGLVALGATPWLWFGTAAMFIAALQLPVAASHSGTIWQMKTPPELQGRIFAVRRVVNEFISPLSVALVGWLAGSIDAGVLQMVLGALLALFGVAMLFSRSLRQVEQPELELKQPSA